MKQALCPVLGKINPFNEFSNYFVQNFIEDSGQSNLKIYSDTVFCPTLCPTLPSQ